MYIAEKTEEEWKQLAGQSLQDQMEFFAAYGKEAGGGISRVFGSEAYRKAAIDLSEYMKVCGMETYIDPVGNVHGIWRAKAENKSGREILIGSHLDTVKEGGIFDGLLGVLAGIFTINRLKQEGKQLSDDLHVIATNGEEGNDLGGTFGSRCLTGKVDLENEAFLEKAKSFGYSKKDLNDARMDFSHAKCWLELHIEQGKTLEEEKKDIGIVTGIVGLWRYGIRILGESNHAGTTMMEYRKDALVRAAQIIAGGDEFARKMGNDLVATFSKVQIHPNVIAVINDQVDMILECRNRKEEILEDFVTQMQKQFQTEDPEAKISVNFTELVKKAPVPCDPKLVEDIEEVCREHHLNYMKMPSGATHDGNMMALKIPIGMIFVPSKKGISHSKEEWTEWSQCERGVKVLYESICRIAEKGEHA